MRMKVVIESDTSGGMGFVVEADDEQAAIQYCLEMFDAHRNPPDGAVITCRARVVADNYVEPNVAPWMKGLH